MVASSYLHEIYKPAYRGQQKHHCTTDIGKMDIVVT